VKHKDRLKKISLTYRKTGEWMKPTNDKTGTKCLGPRQEIITHLDCFLARHDA